MFDCSSDRTPSIWRFFHYEHIDGFAAGHEFEPELVKQDLFKSFGVAVLPIPFIPFEINIETAFNASAVNDWNLEIILELRGEESKRRIGTFKKTRSAIYV
jgi:hypothetical protein